jgi:hypothetical protein
MTLFTKAMKVSPITLGDMTIGEIVNLQSVDTASVSNVFWYIHQVWSAPLQLLVSLGYRSLFLKKIRSFTFLLGFFLFCNNRLT